MNGYVVIGYDEIAYALFALIDDILLRERYFSYDGMKLGLV